MSTHQLIPLKLAAVMSPWFTPTRGTLLQRKCACGGTPGPTGECEACRQKRLQHKNKGGGAETQNASTVPLIVHEVLRSPGEPLDAGTRAFMELRFGHDVHEVLHSPGQPLDAPTRAFMEPHFGHDFSRVRVHTDTKAAESAKAVNALAYTVGQNVVFRNGAYMPQTPSGQRLLAHELVHTIQQEGTQLSSTEDLTVGKAGTADEGEAEDCSRRFSEGGVTEASGLRSKGMVQHVQRWGFGDVRIAEAHQAEEERIQKGCPVKSEGTLSEVSWGETSGLYPSKENKYEPAKWDATKKCELLRLRGAVHAVGQRGEKAHKGRPGGNPVDQKLKPYHLMEHFFVAGSGDRQRGGNVALFVQQGGS